MKPLRCVIVDDDEIDRLTVVAYVKKFPQFEIQGIYASAEEVLYKINSEKVDVLFMDVDMPGISGLELRQKLNEIPVGIFITSYAEHAVESFELEALDFIVKPLKLERFSQTVSRIEKFMEINEKANLFESSLGGDAIYIKEGHEQVKIKLHDILYLEALKDYTLVVTNQKRHCVLSTLGTLLKDDSFSSFVRVHRSYAVQKQYIDKISTQEISLNQNTKIPVGRSYKDNLRLIS